MMTNYQQAKEHKEKQRVLRGLPFKQWWLLYIGIAIIAMLSTFAGGYLGLSPNAAGEITYNSTFDLIGKVLFCGFYMVMFFITAEAAFMFWLDKLILHDVDEKQNSVNIQVWTAWIMMGVSLTTMIVTAIAASQILASWRNSFDNNVAFPTWTSGYVMDWIPSLVIAHIIAATFYKQSTEEAKLERYRRAQMRSARIKALDAGTTAYVTEFSRIAPGEAIKAYTQKAKDDAANMKAEIGIFAEEAKTGKDINKDGFIGNPMQRQFAQETDAPQVPNSEAGKGKP